MNSPVQQIKERLSIEEVVSSYMKLERAGSNLRAKCPFHNEKTPSFFVSSDRGTYYCFGCSASGDIFSFVEEFEGLDFKGALKMLAERAGVALVGYSKESASEKDRLFRAMESAADHFISNLENNKDALKYLKDRGLEEKTVKDFRIGFASADWRDLYNALKVKGFSDTELEKAGLIKKSDKASPGNERGYYDRFRGRVMFPITDTSGRVIAFSGRLLVDDGKSAKYLNSPETPIFSKSAVLYGLYNAKDSIRKNNFSILVEGQMDLILSHQVMYKNTIATSGTALSDNEVSKENAVSNLGLVRRLSNNLVLAFDADAAGFKATKRAGRIALALGMDVKVADMPEGIDPADLISKEGTDAWKLAIKNSKHIIEFILGKIMKSAKDPRGAGRDIEREILPYVSALPSAIEKAHFLKKVSEAASIPIQALEEDLKKIEREEKNEKREIEVAIDASVSLRRKDYIERKLSGIAFWKEDGELMSILGPALEKYKEARNDLIFEAEVFYQNSANLEKDIKELLWNLEEEKINEELLRKMQELRIIEDKAEETKLLKEIQDLNRKKHEKKDKK